MATPNEPTQPPELPGAAVLESMLQTAAQYLVEVTKAIAATPTADHTRPAMLQLKVDTAHAIAAFVTAFVAADVDVDDDDVDDVEPAAPGDTELGGAR